MATLSPVGVTQISWSKYKMEREEFQIIIINLFRNAEKREVRNSVHMKSRLHFNRCESSFSIRRSVDLASLP